MFTLTRRSGESIYIYLDYSKVSPDTTVGEIFGEDGHIAITVIDVSHNKTKLSIDAKREFAIMRSELDV